MSKTKAKKETALVRKANKIEQRRREVEVLKSKCLQNWKIANMLQVSECTIEGDLRAIRAHNLETDREPVESEYLMLGFRQVISEMWETASGCGNPKDKVLALRAIGNQMREMIVVGQSLGYFHKEPTRIEMEERLVVAISEAIRDEPIDVQYRIIEEIGQISGLGPSAVEVEGEGQE